MSERNSDSVPLNIISGVCIGIRSGMLITELRFSQMAQHSDTSSEKGKFLLHIFIYIH